MKVWSYGHFISVPYSYEKTLTLSMKRTWPGFHSLTSPTEKVRMFSQLNFDVPEFGLCLHNSMCEPDDPQYFVLPPKPCKLTHSTDDGHRPHCAARS
jgi:hypothetical protein